MLKDKSQPTKKYRIKIYPGAKIKAMGRGSRQMCKVDKYGFPRTKPQLRQKSFYALMTQDIIKAVVT